jgi:hypothetical protein
MKSEDQELAESIRALLARVDNDTASAMDYILFGELTMWWQLQGKAAAEARRNYKLQERNLPPGWPDGLSYGDDDGYGSQSSPYDE